jgi:hypothetical protein
MSHRFIRRAVAAFAVSLAVVPAAVRAEQGNAAAAAAAQQAAMQPMPLTDAQLQGFFDAVDELKKLGELESVKPGARKGEAQAFAQGLRVSGASQAVLKANGFADVAQFQRVGYNAALAYGVLEQGGKEAVAAKMAKAKAQQAQALDKLRQHMSPEQIQAMAGQMQGAMAMAESIQDVPPQNVELMKKYADRMEALGAD